MHRRGADGLKPAPSWTLPGPTCAGRRPAEQMARILRSVLYTVLVCKQAVPTGMDTGEANEP